MKSFSRGHVAVMAIGMALAPVGMAFSSRTASFFRAPRRRRLAKLQNVCPTATAAPAAAQLEPTTPTSADYAIDDNRAVAVSSSFHPLGPPSFLANLPVGETCKDLSSMNKSITRLSSSPDIFLIRDFILAEEERETLMQSALYQGMKIAGTRQSGENTIRKNSQLAWIDPFSCDNEDDAISIARNTILKSRLCFSHEFMNDLMGNVERMDYAFAEDMQVAKYDAGGRFDFHHDGFGRYLTVLAYLNGVGGTYFPFGDVIMGSELDEIDFTNETEVLVGSGLKRSAEQRGILIVGKEGNRPYLREESTSSVNPKTVIEIQAGDAIAFYNYGLDGEKDLRSLHCGLAVPEEKWIATCWFRSEALTGPFRSMKRARLLEELIAV